MGRKSVAGNQTDGRESSGSCPSTPGIGQQPSRVVILHPSDEWYGADVMLFQAVKALLLAGSSVTVVIADDVAVEEGPLSRELAALGVTVQRHPLPAIRRRYLTPGGLLTLGRTSLRAARRFRRLDADLYLVNTSALALCPLLLRLTGRKQVVAYAHETLGGGEGLLLGLPLSAAHRIVAISEAVRSSLPARARRRTVVVRDAVDNRGEPAPLPASQNLKFLFVGRLSPRKGVAELVEAWLTRVGPGLFLDIVGGHPPLGVAVELPVHEIDRSPWIRVLGEVASVREHMEDAHVVVVPSVAPEGLGLVAVEALERGRPVIASAVPGLTEVVDPEVGWLLDARDPGSWGEVINSVTREGIEARAPRARLRYLERFGEERYRAEFLEALSRPVTSADVVHDG